MAKGKGAKGPFGGKAKGGKGPFGGGEKPFGKKGK